MCNCTSEVWSFGPSRNDEEQERGNGFELAGSGPRPTAGAIMRWQISPGEQIFIKTIALNRPNPIRFRSHRPGRAFIITGFVGLLLVPVWLLELDWAADFFAKGSFGFTALVR